MTRFNVGDKIKFVGPFMVQNRPSGFNSFWAYQPELAIVDRVNNEEIIARDKKHNLIHFHKRQVTHRLKKKEKRKAREIWVPEFSDIGLAKCENHQSKDDCEWNHRRTANFKRAVLFREVIE